MAYVCNHESLKSELAMNFGIPEYLQHTLNHGSNDTLKQAFCSPDSQSQPK
jgi:hypothetical protein